MGTEKNSDHGGSRAQQGYSPGGRESSVRGGGSVTFFFFIVVLWTLVRKLPLLAPLPDSLA